MIILALRRFFIVLTILRGTPNLYLIHPHGSSTLPLPAAPAYQETKMTTSKSHLSKLTLSSLSLYSPCKDPVSSKKCPHSFEKQAIMGIINVSRIRHPGPVWMRRHSDEVVSHPFTSSKFHTPQKPKPPPTNSTYSNLTTNPRFSPPQSFSPIPS